jgi:hypothetical protein
VVFAPLDTREIDTAELEIRFAHSSATANAIGQGVNGFVRAAKVR